MGLYNVTVLTVASMASSAALHQAVLNWESKYDLEDWRNPWWVDLSGGFLYLASASLIWLSIVAMLVFTWAVVRGWPW